MSKEFKKEDLALERTELYKDTVEQIQEKMKSDVVTFSEEIQAIEDIKELKKIEEILMEVFKENDKYLEGVEYDLAGDITYDDQTIKRSEIINNIIYFINKMEVEFRATLGIYQAIRYWKTKGADKVPYGVFDSTLRLLGTLKFQGEADCFKILVINNWFAGAHDNYIRDNAYTNYLAAKHQVIMDRLSKLEGGEPEAVQAVQAE